MAAPLEGARRGVPRADLLAAAVVFGGALALLGTMVFLGGVVTDFWAHAHWALEVRAGTAFPANFLYYLVVAALAGRHPDLRGALLASVVVAAAAVAAKFWLARGAWSEALAATDWRQAKPRPTGDRRSRGRPAEPRPGGGALPDWAPRLALWGAAGLVMAHNLVVPGVAAVHPYLGNFPPNVWHNPTTIAVAPLAFALFWQSYRYLYAGARPRLHVLVLLGLANVFVKPSYAMVFVVVFPLFALARPMPARERAAAATVVAVCLAAIALVYVFVYQRPPPASQLPLYAPSHIAVEPLRVWRHLAPNLPLSFLVSTAFPLGFACAYARQAAASPLFRYAGAHFLVALAMYALLAEAGPRELDGNFAWQLVLCNFMLFFACAVLLSQAVIARGRAAVRDRILIGLAAAHVTSWFVYVHHMLAHHTFA